MRGISHNLATGQRGKQENFKNPANFWPPARTHFLNMAISKMLFCRLWHKFLAQKKYFVRVAPNYFLVAELWIFCKK